MPHGSFVITLEIGGHVTPLSQSVDVLAFSVVMFPDIPKSIICCEVKETKPVHPSQSNSIRIPFNVGIGVGMIGNPVLGTWNVQKFPTCTLPSGVVVVIWHPAVLCTDKVTS